MENKIVYLSFFGAGILANLAIEWKTHKYNVEIDFDKTMDKMVLLYIRFYLYCRKNVSQIGILISTLLF